MNLQFSEISAHFNRDIEIAERLKKNLTAILKAEDQVLVAYTNFYNDLEFISEKENIESLTQIFREATTCFQESVSMLKDYKDLLNTKVEPSISSYYLEVKKLNTSLENLTKLDEEAIVKHMTNKLMKYFAISLQHFSSLAQTIQKNDVQQEAYQWYSQLAKPQQYDIENKFQK
ncbi:hypothetical protein PPERSA_04527 [Pseudocohnilembus persalinus]|uniref:Uncharacterized protein n=1 Tax=Pseudocohnilembus persalinus TaxID=266149 RepID=A0A0V0QT73_PSEPJ|nr:hypothetical protein PPERSA_04527 [Pseudocohnilembus persalinus]|eukprot:KRX05490.1 hypothetical protein PPERSA_04527 [Pseudocohnilembus persalinus]